MNYKAPKLGFLQKNNNPTLGDILELFSGTTDLLSVKKSIFKTIDVLELKLIALDIPEGIFRLTKNLRAQIPEKNIYDLRDTLKGLKRIKLLHNQNSIQEIICQLEEKINNYIDASIDTDSYQKALFFLCEIFEETEKSNLLILKEKSSEPVFNLYIVYQAILYSKADGWAFGIFGNAPELVPHLYTSFKNVGYHKTAKALSKAVQSFPPETEFISNNPYYLDILNFMENPRRKLSTTIANTFTVTDREKHSKQYLDALEEIELSSEEELTQNILNSYFEKYKNKNIWK